MKQIYLFIYDKSRTKTTHKTATVTSTGHD